MRTHTHTRTHTWHTSPIHSLHNKTHAHTHTHTHTHIPHTKQSPLHTPYLTQHTLLQKWPTTTTADILLTHTLTCVSVSPPTVASAAGPRSRSGGLDPPRPEPPSRGGPGPPPGGGSGAPARGPPPPGGSGPPSPRRRDALRPEAPGPAPAGSGSHTGHPRSG